MKPELKNLFEPGKLAGAEPLSAIKKNMLVMILLPPEILEKHIKKILQKSTCVLLLSKGREKTNQMLLSFSKRGVLVGPASFGVANTGNGLVETISGNVQRGKMAIVADDPLLAEMAAERGERYRVGVSKFVCLGETGVQLIEMLEFLKQDRETEIIGLVLKNILKRKDIEFIKSISVEKPVLIFSALTENKIFVSAIKQAGGIPAETLEEMFCGAKMLASGRPMMGRKIAVVTNSKSAGLLAEKWIGKSEMMLAALPQEAFKKFKKGVEVNGFVNLGEEATGEDFQAMVNRVLEEKEIDALLVVVAIGLGKLGKDDLKKVVERCEKCKEKPVALVALGAKTDDIAEISKGKTPVFLDVGDAIAALKISALKR
ncbi:MAG: hypothetical protein QXG38_03215 [Candidatus Hadarchaeales archaeon]